MKYPSEQLKTERLYLRRFTLNDVNDTVALCNNINVVKSLQNLPYPYLESHAIAWINSHTEHWKERIVFEWAIVKQDTHELIGCIGITLDNQHQHGEIGYWIGEPYWNQGYASEATQAIIKAGFEQLDLHRLYAQHFAFNQASGRVMQKVGMLYEGTLKEHLNKDGHHLDICYYGILKSDYFSDTE